MEAYRPRLRYLLIDEGRYVDTRSGPLRSLIDALFLMEHNRGAEDVQLAVGALIEWLKTPEQASLNRAFAHWVTRVLLPARLPGVHIPNVGELNEVRVMLSEQLKTWPEMWMEQGLKKGLQEGRQEGRQEGEVSILKRQLNRKFGVLPIWAETRLANADIATLELWAERVLTAGSLEEVLGADH